jgi:hypothetical protein
MRTSGQKTKFKVFAGTESTRNNTVMDNAMLEQVNTYIIHACHISHQGEI